MSNSNTNLKHIIKNYKEGETTQAPNIVIPSNIATSTGNVVGGSPEMKSSKAQGIPAISDSNAL